VRLCLVCSYLVHWAGFTQEWLQGENVLEGAGILLRVAFQAKMIQQAQPQLLQITGDEAGVEQETTGETNGTSE